MIFNALQTFWSQATTIATGSPEVVARRVAFMNSPAGWTVAGATEIRSMLIEKAEAVLEKSAALLLNVRPATTIGEWCSPGLSFLRAANEMLHPLSERVEANVDRLRAMNSGRV